MYYDNPEYSSDVRFMKVVVWNHRLGMHLNRDSRRCVRALDNIRVMHLVRLRSHLIDGGR